MSDTKRRRPNSSFRASRNSAPLSSQPSTTMSVSAPNVSNSRNAADVSVTGAATRSKTSPSLAAAKAPQRPASDDQVRKIVKEEGRTARNLVTWNVPLEDQEKPRSKSSVGVGGPSLTGSPSHKLSHSPSHKSSHGSETSSQRSHSGSQPGSSVSSPSTQRKQPPSARSQGKKDLRARYWAFLFENLHRAVDEIYLTCEADESVVECKEVIMMLNQCTKDFQSLIERLQLLRAYEDADENSRPTSLAWEVRKSSPGKSLSSSAIVPSAIVSRSLTFGLASQTAASPTANRPANGTGNSWADRVRGVQHGGSTSVPVASVNNISEVAEDTTESADTTVSVQPQQQSLITAADCGTEAEEGWEMVQRTNKTKFRPSPTSGPPCKTSVPARQADGDGRRTASQLRRKEGNCRANVTVSRQTRVAAADARKQHCSVSAVDVSGNCNNSTKSSPINPTQQSKSSSHIGASHGDKGTKSSHRVMQLPLTVNNSHSETVKSETCLTTAEVPAVGAASGTDSKLGENNVTGSGDRRQTAFSESQLHNSGRVSCHSAASHADSSELSVGGVTDVILTHDLSSRTFSSMTEIHRSDSADIQRSSSDSDRQSLYLCRKSVSDDTLVERMTASALSENDADYEDDDDDYDDGDDVRVTDLDDALCSALDEEDSLAIELEKEQQAALESAMLQEQSYLQEIAREQSTEIHVDTEPDTEHEDHSAAGSCCCSGQFDSPLQQSLDWETIAKQFADDLESRRDVPWGELVEDAESRTPGRVVHVHEKLSSPSRKRSATECKKRQEQKQAKARNLREKLLAEKADRLHTLTKKVEEVQQWKNELLNQRRLTMERRLDRAEQKRQLQLQIIVRKAHEEETKANEIAFINSLEAQNKRHEIMSKHQESEARLQDIQEERQRKHEEKAAKEAAVEVRRRALENERQIRFQEMAERRRQRASEFQLRQMEKEKERVEAARAKERDREERIAALNKQQKAQIEELQKKIQLKQEETDRRHKEKLDAIQEKAFRMSILQHSTEDHNNAPKLVPYEKKKLCIVCNVMIPSEVYLLSHLRGKKHQQAIADIHTGRELTRQEIENFNLKHIVDAPLDRPDPQSTCDKERLRGLRKRCKKLRLRLTQRGSEFENSIADKHLPVIDSEHKTKLVKICKDLQKYVKPVGSSSGPWPQNMVVSLDRMLGEITRILDKQCVSDQLALRASSGMSSLSSLLAVIGQSQSDLLAIAPAKSVVRVCSVLRQACISCYDNSLYMLLSNKICTVVDVLSHHLAMMLADGPSSSLPPVTKLPYVSTACSLMNLLSAMLSTLALTDAEKRRSSAGVAAVANADTIASQTTDIVSYIVSLGILDKLSEYLTNVHGPIDENTSAVEFVEDAVSLVTAIVHVTGRRCGDVFDKKLDDPTQLISTLRATQLVGIISLMYGMLLHTDAPARSDTPPPPLPPSTVAIVKSAFNMLNHIACLYLPLLQGSLGEEAMSLEFRHIGSYLLWYCQHLAEDDLLHELVLCIGYFCVLNRDNQVIIQSGQPPTVLQQLCSLPFPYFSDARLINVLFPTLVSCCYLVDRNRDILQQELSCALLANFIEEKILESRQHSGMSKKTKLSNEKQVDSRVNLSARFPADMWQSAQVYFNATVTNMTLTDSVC